MTAPASVQQRFRYAGRVHALVTKAKVSAGGRSQAESAGMAMFGE